MCGISVTKVSLFCDPRESPLEKMRHEFYLMYIRDNIQKEENGTAREEIERYLYLAWRNALRSSSVTINAFRLISLARDNAASCNCTFNDGIIGSRETKRERDLMAGEPRAVRIVVVRDYLCDTSNLKRFTARTHIHIHVHKQRHTYTQRYCSIRTSETKPKR